MIAVMLPAPTFSGLTMPVSLLPIAHTDMIMHQLAALATAGIDTLVIQQHQNAFHDYFQIQFSGGMAIRNSYEPPPGTILVFDAATMPGRELAALLSCHERSRAPLTAAISAADRRPLGLFAVGTDSPAHARPELLRKTSIQAAASQFAMADNTIRIRNVADYLAATAAALGELPDRSGGLRRIANSVWTRGAVYISPRASLAGNILLGQNCSISDGVRIIGPAVIGDGCMICRGARIERSVLWAGSAVGSQARITDALITSGFTTGPGALIDHCVCANHATHRALPLRPGSYRTQHSARGLRQAVEIQA